MSNIEPYLTEKTFAELFEKYYRPCCYMIFNSVKRMSVAEDIVKDCYVGLWVSRKKIPNEIAAKTFIYNSAKNGAINECRHQEVLERRKEDVISLTKQDTGVEQRLIHGQLMANIYRAIDGFPKVQKKIIELCYIDGLGNLTVSEMLGLSYCTVKEHKRVAVKKMRKLFNNQYFKTNYYV